MEIEFAYWFANLPGIYRGKLFRMLEYVSNEEEIYRMPAKDLSVFENILTDKEIEILKHSRNTWDIFREYEKLKDKGILFYYYGQPEFPERLKYIPDKPYALYVKGSLPSKKETLIAVIGARKCTEYGKLMADLYAKELVKGGASIISGMARGIDGIAQNSCLEAEGRTYAVLGCGVDECYPAENRALFEQIPLQGGLISEYPPGTRPQAKLFPPRNRIISGMSEAVLVVEAREKSGTLITVDMALEQGRDVFVIPGRIGDMCSKGCLRLIKQGADVALEPKDILQSIATDNFFDTAAVDMPACILTAEEYTVWKYLDYMPINLEQLMSYTGYMLPKLSQLLLMLELKGAASESGKGYYIKLK